MKNDQPEQYNHVRVSGDGAPEGSVYVHSEATGRTVCVPNDEASYLKAVRDLSRENR